MRYLHPVGPHEVFVGSGTYVTRRDGKPLSLVEHWTIHELPDGAWLMRVDRDGREGDGRSELIEAWRPPGAEEGRVERFDVAASNKPDDVPRRAQMTVEVIGTQVHVGRSLGQAARQADTLDVPDHILLQPGAYAFVGGLLERGDGPLLWRYGRTGGYRAEVATAAVRPGDETRVVVSGKARVARAYYSDWLLGPENAVIGDICYWVDAHGMLVGCELGSFSVTLERYAFR